MRQRQLARAASFLGRPENGRARALLFGDAAAHLHPEALRVLMAERELNEQDLMLLFQLEANGELFRAPGEQRDVERAIRE